MREVPRELLVLVVDAALRRVDLVAQSGEVRLLDALSYATFVRYLFEEVLLGGSQTGFAFGLADARDLAFARLEREKARGEEENARNGCPAS